MGLSLLYFVLWISILCRASKMKKEEEKEEEGEKRKCED